MVRHSSVCESVRPPVPLSLSSLRHDALPPLPGPPGPLPVQGKQRHGDTYTHCTVTRAGHGRRAPCHGEMRETPRAESVSTCRPRTLPEFLAAGEVLARCAPSHPPRGAAQPPACRSRGRVWPSGTGTRACGKDCVEDLSRKKKGESALRRYRGAGGRPSLGLHALPHHSAHARPLRAPEKNTSPRARSL